MSEIKPLVEKEFKSANLQLENLVFIASSGGFGDFTVEAFCEFGSLIITRDRGQFFIDLSKGGELVGAESKYSSLVDIYKSGNWDLTDLLLAIKVEEALRKRTFFEKVSLFLKKISGY